MITCTKKKIYKSRKNVFEIFLESQITFGTENNVKKTV